MEDYKVKTIELPRTKGLPRTKELPKVKTGDFLPPELQKKPNIAARFLKGFFINNWPLKLTAIISAAAIWGVLVFV